MCTIKSFVIILTICVLKNDGARILAVYPTPSISHQIVFRPLTLELLKRGHELVVVTTDPIFPKGEAPANLTEIDVHFSYDAWHKSIVSGVTSADKDDHPSQMKTIYELLVTVIESQMATEEMQKIVKDKSKKFDVLLLEAFMTPTLVLSHIFKAPVIHLSSFGSVINNLEIIGASTHLILYPTMTHQRLYNLTFWEKIDEIYKQYRIQKIFDKVDSLGDEAMARVFGPGIPPISKLKDNVDMFFMNAHPIWENNRPVPPNVVYMPGLHQAGIVEKPFPQDLKDYLDSSKNGVIYVSFGTNVDPSKLPEREAQTLINVFSKLPYDVLWKWGNKERLAHAKNIRTEKWLPQAALLKHPKIKLFIMQGGLQSTDESISAGVPLIGIPMLGDQWYNSEHFPHLKIGLYVDMSTITEEKLNNTIKEVINNKSYRDNIMKLRDIIQDQPESSLERAVWWTEYVIRHKGARHLRSPAANMPLAEYLELDLILIVLSSVLSVAFIIVYIIYKIIKSITSVNKLKVN